MKKTISITIKIEDENIFLLQDLIEKKAEIVSLKILPSTDVMYEEDATFKKLVDAVKKAKKIKDVYINDHNNKYFKN